MIDNRSDPQGAAEIWQAKLDTAIEAYAACEISEDVFSGTLFALGFRGQELRSELALHRWRHFEHRVFNPVEQKYETMDARRPQKLEWGEPK